MLHNVEITKSNLTSFIAPTRPYKNVTLYKISTVYKIMLSSRLYFHPRMLNITGTNNIHTKLNIFNTVPVKKPAMTVSIIFIFLYYLVSV